MGRSRGVSILLVLLVRCKRSVVAAAEGKDGARIVLLSVTALCPTICLSVKRFIRIHCVIMVRKLGQINTTDMTSFANCFALLELAFRNRVSWLLRSRCRVRFVVFGFFFFALSIPMASRVSFFPLHEHWALIMSLICCQSLHQPEHKYMNPPHTHTYTPEHLHTPH